MNRPFHALTAAGMLAHHGYELAAGVGLVGQHKMGLAGSSSLWGGLVPPWLLTAERGSSRWSPLLGFGVGASLAGVAVHYMLWPWELRRGLPTLTEAEALKQEQLPAYNAVLWFWGLTALLAVFRETPRSGLKWVLLGLLTIPLMRTSATEGFEWLREQARTNPAWWNRAHAEREGDEA